MTTARSFGYGRFSKDEQSRYSLEVQEDEIRRYVELKRLPPLLHYFTDAGVSASEFHLLERQGGLSLHQAARRGDHIIFYRLDRGFRNTIDCLKMMHVWLTAGIHVHFIDIQVDTSTPFGGLVVKILAAIAEWDNEVRAERIRAGLKKASEEGRLYCTFGTMLGAKIVRDHHGKAKKDGKDRPIRVPYPEEVRVLQLVWHLNKVCKVSHLATARLLTRMDVRPPRAKQTGPYIWNRSRVYDYLRGEKRRQERMAKGLTY